jgi:hypothetical protein
VGLTLRPRDFRRVGRSCLALAASSCASGEPEDPLCSPRRRGGPRPLLRNRGFDDSGTGRGAARSVSESWQQDFSAAPRPRYRGPSEPRPPPSTGSGGAGRGPTTRSETLATGRAERPARSVTVTVTLTVTPGESEPRSDRGGPWRPTWRSGPVSQR